MNISEKAEIAVRAAREKSMSSTVWTKDENEIRVYLRRMNAARTEAGYIRIWNQDGKSYSKYVQTASGSGSRTSESEAEAVFSHYQALRKAAVEAAKVVA
jgi:hypothetical protein